MDMNTPAFHSIICPVLIGRTSHLEALVHLLEQACLGQGQTVLIAGEAGIGKSRLVSEATALLHSSASLATSAAVLTLQGHCFEQDVTLPYAPLLDMLRPFFASRSPEAVVASLVQMAPELVKLLPELATVLPDLAPGSPLEPEQEKRRLYQALLDFFRHLSATQPLLLIIEDVHWSDDSTLEFLLFLARRLASHPILLLLTYRSEEEHPAFTRFLAGLDRERLATELTLTRLGTSEVGAMLRAILALPHPVRADVLEAIYLLTEGNPFFIEEMLKSLITAGTISYAEGMLEFKPHGEAGGLVRIPRSVQVAVQERLDHLSPGARQLLDFAAVAGRRFDFALLQQLMQRHESELLPLFKELITAQLVVEEAEDIFAFRHALTRQAVYVDLLARERKVLHRSIAETMELLYADTLEAHVSDLAYHFFAAGTWTKALEYGQRAGEKAQHLYATRAAIEHFTHALQAARQLPVPLFALYRARGQAYQTLGEFDHARSDFEQALHTAFTLHNTLEEWQSLLALGDLWTERNYEQAGHYFHRAIGLARSMDDPATLAHTLNRVGNWYANREQPQEGQPFHQEALDIFHGLHDQHGLAETLDLLGTTSLMGGLLRSGIAYYEQAITFWRTLGDRQHLISSLGMATMRGPNYLSDSLIWMMTNGQEYIRDAEEAVALARQMGWRAGEAYALTFLGVGLGPRGEYGRAWMYGQAALDIAVEIEHGLWMTFAHFLLGSLCFDLLALSTARNHFEHALSLAKESSSLFWLRVITGTLASTCVRQRDFARAESLLNAVADTMPQLQTTAQRFIWCARAELELARQHPESAVALIDQLIASAHMEPGDVIPRLWHLYGEVLITCDRKAEAEVMLNTAYIAANAQGLRARLWRIKASLAQLAAAQGRRKQAAELSSEAHKMIQELATTAPQGEIRDTFLSSATALLPYLPVLSPRREARKTFGELTEREREVAALIVQGRSNRAIAEELIVSERTIEKHVERIMSKLGFDSRSQIAVWAVEKGLQK